MITRQIAEIRAAVAYAAASKRSARRDHQAELDAREEVAQRLRQAAEWLDDGGWLPDRLDIPGEER